MFRAVKSLQTPLVRHFKTELPQDFPGEFRHGLRPREITMTQIQTINNPDTHLTPYTKLFLKISNRKLS